MANVRQRAANIIGDLITLGVIKPGLVDTTLSQSGDMIIKILIEDISYDKIKIIRDEFINEFRFDDRLRRIDDTFTIDERYFTANFYRSYSFDCCIKNINNHTKEELIQNYAGEYIEHPEKLPVGYYVTVFEKGTDSFWQHGQIYMKKDGKKAINCFDGDYQLNEVEVYLDSRYTP